ncbi:MAG: HAMP domain-containing sensor histidine kinase [Candidatus Aquicultorales bacterium]
MKLGTRLTLIYLLIVSLSLILLGTLASTLIKSHLIGDTARELTRKARISAELLSNSGELEDENMQKLVNSLAKQANARVTIIRQDGEVLADSQRKVKFVPNQGEKPEVIEALTKGEGQDTRWTASSEADIYYIAMRLGDGRETYGLIRFAVPTAQLEDEFAHLSALGILSTVVSALAAVILGFLFVRSVTKPIKQMTDMAEQIAAGDLSPRTSVRGRDEVGKLAESLNIMADQLSARMKALINSHRRRQLLIDHMTDGIMLLSARGSIVIANTVAQEMLGLRADRLIGRPVLEAIHSDELAGAIAAAAKSDKGVDCMVTLGARNQQVAQVSVLGIRDDEETFLVIFHDITKEHSLDTMRRDFITNFSHELKTPITGLKLLAETLSDAVREGSEEATYFADVIRDETTRIASFVEKLMELAKLDSNEMRSYFERVSVMEIIEEVAGYCEPLAREKELALVLEKTDADIPLVEGDYGQLRMVFQNLIENAIKYTLKGGVTVSVKPSGGWVEIIVRDTGIGIAEEDLPRIFERFFRADKARSRATGGTGLGLSIVSRIIDKHHGKIDVESDFGHGSTFRISLPVSQPGEDGVTKEPDVAVNATGS